MNAVVFGLLLVVCAFEVSHADMLTNMRIQLQQAQSKVDSVNNDLDRTIKNLDYNTKNKIGNKKIEHMGNVNNFVNPALTQIRNDVDAAKAEGKDAEHCFTAAKDSLRTVSLNGFAALDECDKEAKNVLSQALSPLQQQQSIGQSIKTDLAGIFPSCQTSNIIQMTNCIALKLGTANQAIRNYESLVSSAKLQANNDANKAVLSITTCGMNATNNVRAGTTDARLACNNCVRNA